MHGEDGLGHDDDLAARFAALDHLRALADADLARQAAAYEETWLGRLSYLAQLGVQVELLLAGQPGPLRGVVDEVSPSRLVLMSGHAVHHVRLDAIVCIRHGRLDGRPAHGG